jgi:formyltetrahydrofolate synthetase
MGSGVAKTIRDRWPIVYKEYSDLSCPEEMLGRVQFVEIGPGKWVANLFSQFDYVRNYRQDVTVAQNTNYAAMELGFSYIAKLCKKVGYSVAMPYGIGCARGGGDWSVVMNIIEKCFEDVPVTLYKL